MPESGRLPLPGMCEKPQSFLVDLGVVLCRHEAWRCGDRQQRWNWRRLLDDRLDDWRLRPAAPQPGQVENAAREKTDRDCEQAELKSAVEAAAGVLWAAETGGWVGRSSTCIKRASRERNISSQARS